jgi:hypothetical protein
VVDATWSTLRIEDENRRQADNTVAFSDARPFGHIDVDDLDGPIELSLEPMCRGLLRMDAGGAMGRAEDEERGPAEGETIGDASAILRSSARPREYGTP